MILMGIECMQNHRALVFQRNKFQLPCSINPNTVLGELTEEEKMHGSLRSYKNLRAIFKESLLEFAGIS
jgi:hypothetical protein